MNKDRYQSTSARRALALLNSPLISVKFLKMVKLTVAGVNATLKPGRESSVLSDRALTHDVIVVCAKV